MKLTKKTESDVLQVYNTWLHSYLHGDVKTYDLYLDDDYHFIGSTNNEEFLNRKDTTQFFEDTAEQFSGKTELRNESKILEQFKELIFITHFFDAWFLSEAEWVYYGRFRFSSVLRNNREGWRFIYQHFSMPDSKAQEGETIGYDQISAENLQLREAIKRRTVELENKNRELEIETSLERVRARTMAMQHSSELGEVASVLFDQMNELVSDLWTCGFVLCEKGRQEDEWWLSMDGGFTRGFFLPNVGDYTHKTLYEGWLNQDSFRTVQLEKDMLQEHYNWLMEIPLAQKIFEDMEASGIQKPDWQKLHAAYFSKGYLCIITQVPCDEEEIFKRFAKVFDLTYTRFLDLKKAEAQAREVQIELALERVRSRTMGMQKSEELKDVVKVIFDQLAHLSINAEHAGIVVDYEPKKDWHFWIAETQDIPAKVTVPYLDLVWDRQFTEAKKKGQDFFTTLMDFEEKNSFYKVLLPHIEGVTNKARDFYFSCPGLAASTVLEKDIGLYIENFSGTPYSTEENDVLKRFAKVFQQTYTRFLDLQKAEAQAREAQIELGLERVRARAMAMQHSRELSELVSTIFQELTKLDFALTFCIINVINEADRSNTVWAADPITGKDPESYYMKFEDYEFHHGMWDAWKSRKNKWVYTMEGSEKKIYDEYLYRDTEFRRFPMEVQEANRALDRYVCGFTFSNFGGLQTVSEEPISEANLDILARFGKVFDLTYTRFSDLKHAETQAREAQIETALERVRSRTMGMQSSEELADAAFVLFEQLRSLGGNLWGTGFGLCEKNSESDTFWFANEKGVLPPGSIPNTTDPAHKSMYEGWKRGADYLAVEASGEDLKNHYKYMMSLEVVRPFFQEILDKGLTFPEWQQWNAAYFSKGYLLIISLEPYPEPEILKRFAKVFDQTYTRFLDLQKAEAQAREARINLSVERVRAMALAMHKSEDIMRVVAKLKDEVMSLDIPDVAAATIFLNEGDNKIRMWDLTSIEKSDDGYQVPLDITFTLKKSDPYLYVKRVWETTGDYFVETQDEKGFKRILEWLREHGKTEVAHEVEEYINTAQIKLLHHATKKLRNGKLCIDVLSPPSQEMESILTKMGAAFDLAYQRFEDLQKAEAQTREARIESALERVRAKSMAMHKSEELAGLSLELVKQVQALGVQTWFCAFNIYDDNPQGSLEWGSNGQGTFPKYRTPREGVFLRYYEAGQKGETLLINEIGGNECTTHYEYLCGLPGVGEQLLKMKDAGIPFPTSQIDHVAYFRYGYILFITYEPVPESHDIFKRFARVFEQTYTRFLDLKKVEAQTRSAQIEAALERVRARALAMQDPGELTEVAEVLRYEMGLLGVEELETSSIYINDEENEKTECWYALKDIRSEGKTLVSDHFPLHLKDTWVGREMQKFYASDKEQVSIVMKGEARKEWIRYCEEHSAPFQGYYGEEIPDRTYHLYKFSHGAIGAASAGDISKESWDLLKRSASVFSLAYSRFKDLTQARIDLARLKEEKKRAEEALRELQITQAQLIQSEKMASLGELTAGIAHEIQNPLNFVNNFSEVSVELIEEMNEELEKGDLEEAMAIIQDVRQNLAKINHHGKRADGIVKGMLQHSRSSGGEKEPTDLNMLADEYLRLAYHGLRAKDKSFNATLDTHFDESIGKVKVIPQDMGRVILNLITNAFYAVREKKNHQPEGYEPAVTVTTLKDGNKVFLAVKDNGNGIPDAIKDKIFQPFFTTKPTGEGTGLGLSMSYDIITKGHGGELKVETEEGEGTVFIITLKNV